LLKRIVRFSTLAATVGVTAVLLLAPAALAQSGDLDCSQFATREAPQAILDANPYGRDIYGLDPNANGVACEVSANGVAEDGTAAPVGLQPQRPAATATAAAAAGATAICRDDTVSFSRHRSGTCSHHGGVARWL
jgi:hypothetical protein